MTLGQELSSRLPSRSLAATLQARSRSSSARRVPPSQRSPPGAAARKSAEPVSSDRSPARRGRRRPRRWRAGRTRDTASKLGRCRGRELSDDSPADAGAHEPTLCTQLLTKDDDPLEALDPPQKTRSLDYSTCVRLPSRPPAFPTGPVTTDAAQQGPVWTSPRAYLESIAGSEKVCRPACSGSRTPTHCRSTPTDALLIVDGEQLGNDPERNRLPVDLPPVVVTPRARSMCQILAVDAAESGTANLGGVVAGNRYPSGRQMREVRSALVDGPWHTCSFGHPTRRIRRYQQYGMTTVLWRDTGFGDRTGTHHRGWTARHDKTPSTPPRRSPVAPPSQHPPTRNGKLAMP